MEGTVLKAQRHKLSLDPRKSQHQAKVIAWESTGLCTPAMWPNMRQQVGRKAHKTVSGSSLEPICDTKISQTRVSISPGEVKEALGWKAQRFGVPLYGASDLWRSLSNSKSAIKGHQHQYSGQLGLSSIHWRHNVHSSVLLVRLSQLYFGKVILTQIKWWFLNFYRFTFVNVLFLCFCLCVSLYLSIPPLYMCECTHAHVGAYACVYREF